MKTDRRPITPALVRRTLAQTRLRPLVNMVKNYGLQHHEIERQKRDGILRPTAMHLELTTYCTQRCKDCYIPISERRDKAVMSIGTAREAVRVGREMGIRIFNFIGGEPLSEPTIPIIQALTRENRGVSFYTCTNGQLLSTQDPALDEWVRIPNLSIGLSVDGFKTTNDRIRGAGTLERTERAARFLRERRCFFGAVVTIRPENAVEVLSEPFMDWMVQTGFSYVFYSVSDAAAAERFRQVAPLAEDKPIFFYLDTMGTLDDLATRNRVRLIYVARDGELLNDRQERIPLGTLADAGEYATHASWTKRFLDSAKE